MPTILTDAEKREAIAGSRERDHLKYLEYEKTKEAMEDRRSEITDMTERLTMPMETTFEFELRDDDKLYSEFDTPLDDVVYDGYEDIKQKAEHRPDLAFEVERCRLDTEEIEEVKTLEPGGILVTFLPIPDDVREGKTSIGGYNRKRQRMLARFSQRGMGKLSHKFSITSLSLDGSDPKAIRAAARAIRHEIPEGLSSEEIVANRRHISPLEQTTAKKVVEIIRGAYDDELARTRGGEWYAGIDAKELEESYANAYDYVSSQNELMDQHMAFLRDLESRLDGAALEKAKEDARYNLAAALDDKRKGKAVTSISDSGANARAVGMNYDGDCPTGNSAASTETQANALGFRTEKFKTNCPLCGTKGVEATRANGVITCGTCEGSVDVCTGETKMGKKPKKSVGSYAVQETVQRPSRGPTRAERLKAMRADPDLMEYKIIIPGGAEHYFTHKQTGQRIDA
jgi:hypothetical protein